MPVARKDHGPCLFCGLPILKGDVWSQGADLDEGWMETKQGMKVRPGQSFDSFHEICFDFVIGDGEGYSDPQDDLDMALYSIFGDIMYKEHDWKKVIQHEIPQNQLAQKDIEVFKKWKTFIEGRLKSAEGNNAT